MGVQVLARGRIVTPDGVVFGEVIEEGGVVIDVVARDRTGATGSDDGLSWV